MPVQGAMPPCLCTVQFGLLSGKALHSRTDISWMFGRKRVAQSGIFVLSRVRSAVAIEQERGTELFVNGLFSLLYHCLVVLFAATVAATAAATAAVAAAAAVFCVIIMAKIYVGWQGRGRRLRRSRGR